MARKDTEKAQKIRDDINRWDKYWGNNNKQWHEWTGFILGDQWREDESKLFERYNKIPLTFNKLAALTNHLLGDQMQNTPNLQICPSENVPVQTAEIRAALIKNISLNSHAKNVYQTAFGHAVIGGFGAYRIGTKYAHDYSFDQDIEFHEIQDPTRCYWDISAKSPCKTDGMRAGFRERMSRKMFRAIYGKKLERSIGPTPISEDSTLAFADDDSITIIYDYERKYDTVTIYKLSDEKGTVIDEDEFKDLEKIEIDGQEMLIFEDQPVTVLQKRESPKYKVKYSMIAGDYFLEEEDFASQQLPIVFVNQKSYFDKRGYEICRPFFQDVKDAQRSLNYIGTQSAYLLKISRYDQFMGSRANVKNPDTQQIWRDPSVQQGMLVYDESPNGNKPEQLRPPELSQSLLQQYERALMDIQSGTGMYNAQIGEQGNEVSGKAVDSRTKRGSYNTYIPKNSINLAIMVGGEIVNEMIPKIYDTQRLMMLAMPDNQNSPVEINKPMDMYGSETENDMTTGRYTIRLMPGPSYEGQKTEALESMQMVLQNDPSLFRLIGDLYVENLPLENNIELKNRIRTIIPPEIIEAGKTGKPIPPKPPQPSPEEIMAQLKQKELEFKMQQAQQDFQARNQELELKKAEIQRKALETHQDMTMAWEKVEAEKQEAAANLQESILRFQAEARRDSNDMQMNHANNLVKLLTHHPKEPKQAKDH